MGYQDLAKRARKHWAEWLPRKTAELKATGMFAAATQAAAVMAQQEIEQLMAMGYQEHEAQEVALQKHVLLPPEPAEADEQDRELAEREAEYQEMMREPPEMPEPEPEK